MTIKEVRVQRVVNALIGREEVMQGAQDTLISSIFWTERIGPAASLAAMRDEDAPARIDQIGLEGRRLWADLAGEALLPIETSGFPARGWFAVKGLDSIVLRAFVSQELLKNRSLGWISLYASVAYENAAPEAYAEQLRAVFTALTGCVTRERVFRLLPDGTAQSGFERLA